MPRRELPADSVYVRKKERKATQADIKSAFRIRIDRGEHFRNYSIRNIEKKIFAQGRENA